MSNYIKLTLLVILTSLLNFYTEIALATGQLDLTVEELRIEKAIREIPEVVSLFNADIEYFKSQLDTAMDLSMLTQVVERHSQLLWTKAVSSFATLPNFDDRPLYWARLQSTRVLREAASFRSLSDSQQKALLWQLELISRGQADVDFKQQTNKKILITGFDPFFLDRNIDQSNPSGAVALAFDNMVIESHGVTAEIESLILPVRFEDFDKGIVEQLLSSYFQEKNSQEKNSQEGKVAMVITISMGRDDFDIERFPGLRRSAKAPDNANVYTGADAENPLIPLLNDEPLKGPEFLQFSLPVKAMTKAKGDFKVIDNHKVTTMQQSFSPNSLEQLSGQIAVSGSGGGYLSNEVSYRSLLLRDSYNPTLPVGHIHLPRFTGFNPEKTEKIIRQLKSIITMAISEI